MEKILLAQLIAHIIADFFAQPEWFCRKKQLNYFASWHAYVHVLIVFTLSFGMTFSGSFIWYAVVISVSHFFIDGLKYIIQRRFESLNNYYLFVADQVLHLLVIIGVVFLFWTINPSIPAYLELVTMRQLSLLAGVLLCMKPANVLIRTCLSSLGFYDPEKGGNDLERAGRWIGTLERLITMVLIILQQYTAIGFIIAAKSILRYNDSKTGKTEYVLIGTLLSFGIALFLGVIIKEGFFWILA